ncbi:hypothetical protein C0058_27360 [Pseudomonas sp. NC02]|nr:hypothetical protein C0058_27360 [Pseudomonas sp. NC02]QBQ13482.1 hypothetical protein DCC84_28740 [Pseudomonas sp. SXM-1]
MARELAPAGARSGPDLCLKRLGLLRSPAGASSLATMNVFAVPGTSPVRGGFSRRASAASLRCTRNHGLCGRCGR